jgi:hypothetical protein
MVPILTGSACYYTGSQDVMKQLLIAEGKTHLIKPKDLLASILCVSSLSATSVMRNLLCSQALGRQSRVSKW